MGDAGGWGMGWWDRQVGGGGDGGRDRGRGIGWGREVGQAGVEIQPVGGGGGGVRGRHGWATRALERGG